jgi:hypothetical protein
MFRVVLFGSLVFLVSTNVFANDNNHSVGLVYSYSTIDNESSESTSELNDLVTSHFSYSYQYNFSEYISVGLGQLDGDSSKADGGIVDVFTDSKIDYSSKFISVVASYPLTNKSSVYFKVNALRYDYDIIDDNESVYQEDGNDFSYTLGCKYILGNGFGFEAGYEILNLGDRVDISGFNVGISYNF